MSKLKAVGPPLLLGVIFIAAVIFIFSGTPIFPAGLFTSSRPTSPTPSAPGTGGTSRAGRTPTLQTARPTHLPSSTPGTDHPGQGAAGDALVATVNGRDISYELWQEVTLLDRAMNELVGQAVPSAEETLDRLINEILVLQAANLEGATVAEADVEKRIAALEEAWKVSDDQAVAALRQVGLEREALVRRTGRLILIEQGLATIAAERGDANAWLVQARREAQIGLYKPLASSSPSGTGGEAETTVSPPTGLETAPRPGALAPDFTLSNLEGENVNLRSLRGKPVLINFWATWCPPCRAELPALRSAYAQYQEQGLEILAVNVKENRETVAAFAANSDLTFPLLLDDGGVVAAIYQVRGTPTSLFVGPDGVITARHLGPLDQETLESYLAPLMTGQDNR